MIATKKLFVPFVVLMAFSLYFFNACNKVDAADGERIDKRYELADFNKISYELGGSLHYSQKAGNEVKVTATQNVINALDIFVKDDVLYITSKKGVVISNQDEIEFTVSDDDTYEIYTSGSGNLYADFDENYQFNSHLLKTTGSGSIFADWINADQQELYSTGSGNIEIDHIISSELIAKTTGSGSLALKKGEVNTGSIKVTGAGDYIAFETPWNEVDVTNSGSGSTYIRCLNTLDVTVSGTGNVHYKGYPIIIQAVTGTGTVIDAN